jgi:hypothetical protein
VTAGRKLFLNTDGNTAWSRLAEDLVAAHIQDLGGMENLSTAQLALVKYAAACEAELEKMASRMSRGEVVDIDRFTRTLSHLRRVFESVGIKRVPRDVQQTVEQYLSKPAHYPESESSKPGAGPRSAVEADV